MARRYHLLDVFTSEPLEGNQLAVVLDADGLNTAAMQRIAAEFNLSETVFVLQPENPVHAASIRIFTPAGELPFAGHPTIGTAVALAAETGADALIVLEEKIGPIRCAVTLRSGGGHAMFDAPRLPEVGVAGATADIAKALGVDENDVGFATHIPTVYDAGTPFAFVPIRNIAAMAVAEPQQAAWATAFGDLPAYLYTRDTVSVARQFHARMFAPRFGIAEDAATGSAAVALAAVIHRFEPDDDGTHDFIIEQGFEIGRPSLIHLQSDIEGGELVRIRLGGDAVLVGRGTLDV